MAIWRHLRAIGLFPGVVTLAVPFGVNATYVPLFEERGLASRFGDNYLIYKRNVPRWIPA